jgi:group I intron endonuclease
MPAGVYSLTFPSGKEYIGSDKYLPNRRIQHTYDLERNRHVNCLLQNAWNKYKAFEYKILLICPPELVLFFEQKALDAFKPAYNIAQKADCPPSALGRRHKEETKLKMSVAALGKKRSAETCLRISKAKRGIRYPPRTEEHRRKLSLARLGKPSILRGRKQSPELIAKRTCKPQSQETKDKRVVSILRTKEINKLKRARIRILVALAQFTKL